MISNLPKWSWVGFGILAFSAGMINGLALLGFSHQAATHMTGLLSHFAIEGFNRNGSAALTYLLVVLSFFLGAFICGLIIQDPHFKAGRRYGVALGIESSLLFLSAYGFFYQRNWAPYVATLAAGLQNAIVSHFSGAVVRTTHMTGVLTDLGFLVGHWVQGREVDDRKIKLFLLLLISFAAGCYVCAFAYSFWETRVMIVPAILVGILAVSYECLRRNNSSSKK